MSYETEALQGGWSVRQLDRQISSQFHTRAMLSKNKRTMLEKGSKAHPSDFVTPEEAIKDPYVLEFLDLKDEYSESQLEDALVHRLEDFSCSSSAATLRSSDVNDAYESVKAGFGSIYYFFTDACDASSLSI